MEAEEFAEEVLDMGARTYRKKYLLLFLFILIGITFVAGMGLGRYFETTKVCVDKEKLIAKGEAYLAEKALSERTYAVEILQIGYLPSGQERFLANMDVDGKEEILQKERESNGYIVMYIDWYEPDRGQSFRKYYMISIAEDKDVIGFSDDIPLADGTTCAFQDPEKCDAAERALREYLSSQGALDSVLECQVSENETKKMVQYYAATEEGMMLGWTKDFLENRFLVITLVQRWDAADTTEKDQYTTKKNVIMICDVSTNEWVFQTEY